MLEAGNSRTFRAVLLFLIPAVLCSLAYSKIIYVDDDAAGADDGTSWENAYIYLQDALADAEASEKPVEIRVAQGVYKPNQRTLQTPNNGDNTFTLINEVTLKGGYAGFGEPDPNSRDIETCETILSGDLNGDDIVVDDPCDMLLVQSNRADNSSVVVRANYTDATTVLDGFVITGGCFMDMYTMPSNGGAGMHIYQGSPTIRNCTFTGNAAYYMGGGLLNRDSSNPTLVNCAFTRNYARLGGGIYNNSNMSAPGRISENSHPTLVSCTFDNNYALINGGGMYNSASNPTLTDCTFRRNQVTGPYSGSTRGSHTGGGGGIYNSNSNPELTNCLFSENSAGGGGGICNGNDSSIALKNCTFIGNSASQAGAGLLNPEDSTLTLTNCRFINNTVTGIGGGVWNGSANATLVDCVFSGNSAHDGQIPYVSEIIPGSGGGMSAGGTPTLIRCTFRSNYATNGAGIIGGSGELAECVFTGNSASEDGGAIHTGGDPIITNCTFSGNSANRGGGIFFTWGAKMTMANCTFTGNSASTGNALASDPHLPSLPGYFQLMNCILWDGEDTIFDPDPYALRSAITYSNIQGGWPGDGNIDVDPDFVQMGYWTQPSPRNPNSSVWIEGDYHLKSEAGRWDSVSESWIIDNLTSPCIDAGDPNIPVGDEPDPNGGRINMGAYGGTAEASKSPGYSWWFETTQGPVLAKGLGIVLPHEHIFTDLRGPTTPGYGQADAADVVRVMAPLLSDAREKGVGAMFECSGIGVGRNVSIIAHVAETSGLPVVVPTGVYGRANFAPPEHRNMTEDELATLFISEIQDGIDGTGIKAGFIKIAIDEGPMNALLERILRAAGRAASETGAAIASHTPTGSNAVRQVDILESIDPAIRFIWVHAQNESNRNIHVQLAARGAYIEFDSLGWNPGQDSTYISAIKNLLAAGHSDRILLSHDAGWYQPGSANGGTQKPFTYLIDTFIPKLRDAGVDDATIRMITQTNPVRAFGFKSDK